MSNGSSEKSLLSSIVRVARQLPGATVEELALAVESLKAVPSAAETVTVVGKVTKASNRRRVEKLLARWAEQAPNVPPVAIAWALRGATALDDWRRENESTELVWTGPAPHGTSLRRNDQALFELIKSARASEQLTLVTFTAFKLDKLQQILREAIDRGVDVHLVVETPVSGKVGFDPVLALGADVADASTVWVWPPELREKDENGNVGTMHAKLALVGDRKLLVSSANLTGFAMHANIEMGVLIEGGELPKRVAAHLFHLMHTANVFRPVVQ